MWTLTIQRILEKRLECADCHLSTAKIIDGLSSANLLVYSEKTRPVYLKIANNPDFDLILSAFSMTPLFSRNTRKDIRDIIALQIWKYYLRGNIGYFLVNFFPQLTNSGKTPGRTFLPISFPAAFVNSRAFHLYDWSMAAADAFCFPDTRVFSLEVDPINMR